MDTEPGYVKSKKELKREEKAREKRYKDEERQIKKEERARKKGKAPERKKIKTGGFVDEIYEDDLEEEEAPEQEPTVRPVRNVQAATSEAHELLKKEIAAATADDSQELPEDYFDAPGNLTERISLLESDLAQEEDEEEEEPIEIKKLAIPRRTATQLANRARKAGDTPDVVRDSITKVTLFDYSDIIAGEDDVEEEE